MLIGDIAHGSLRRAVARFANRERRRLSTKHGADGNCIYASSHFLDFYALEYGGRGEVVEWWAKAVDLRADGSYEPNPPVPHHWFDMLHRSHYRHHGVALADGVYIDFTARQFNERAPYPLLWQEER